MKNSIIYVLAIFASSAMALGIPQKATDEDVATLVAGVQIANATKAVACTNVISVATAGSIGSAIGGLCSARGENSSIYCYNSMTGGPVGSTLLMMNGENLVSQILALIEDKCTGG